MKSDPASYSIPTHLQEDNDLPFIIFITAVLKSSGLSGDEAFEEAKKLSAILKEKQP